MDGTFYGVVAIAMLFVLALLVLVIIGAWKIFQKAGYEGWECIVPVYNGIIFLKIIGKPSWWLIFLMGNLIGTIYGIAVSNTDVIYTILSLVLGILSLVYTIWSFNMLSKSFGKDEGFTVGLVILPYVFLPILGIGSTKYLGPYGDPALFCEYNQSKDGFDFEHNRMA